MPAYDSHVPHMLAISCRHVTRLLTHIDTRYLYVTHKSKHVNVMVSVSVPDSLFFLFFFRYDGDVDTSISSVVII